MQRERSADWSEEFRQSLEGSGLIGDLRRCLACGKCTAACPVAAVTPSYNPRQIIREALLGHAARLVASEEIWRCFWCFGCYSVCPSRIKFPMLILLLRYHALRCGSGRKYVAVFKRFVDKAKADGVTFLPGNPKRLEKIKALRSSLGLPPLREVSEAGRAEYARLYEASGTSEWLRRVEAGPEGPLSLSFAPGRIAPCADAGKGEDASCGTRHR